MVRQRADGRGRSRARRHRRPAPGDILLEIFELVLEHEQYVTRRINDLYALAGEERDYASQTLLQWFVSEQMEEEEAARDVIDDLRLVGDSGASLFLLDRELGQRQPEQEGGE